MKSSASYPMPLGRNLILALLLLLAAAAWATLIWQSSTADEQTMGLTMGMSGPLFLAIWVAMMAAMMFPTAAPMILTFAHVHASKRQRGQAFVPTWVFVGAYLAVWTLFGALAYAAAEVAQALAESSPWLATTAPRVGGALIALAGLYQLSPLKGACLAKCRSPLAFILNSWRDGYVGSFRMGLAHGAYCLGCCWMLFAILFPLGVMNVAAMAAITVVIFAEKSLPAGPRVARLVAVALIAYGLLVVVAPEALPATLPQSGIPFAKQAVAG